MAALLRQLTTLSTFAVRLLRSWTYAAAHGFICFCFSAIRIRKDGR